MAVVTYNEETYSCSKAIKGSAYIHLLDSNDTMIASWDNITDFDLFTISGGSWQSPTADSECNVAVVADDGTIHKGTHKCSDIHPITVSTTDITAGTTALATGSLYLVYS